MLNMTPRDKILQAFLAQGVADAFCYEFEFYRPTKKAVQKHHTDKKPLSITDDTQMALFGLYALGSAKRWPMDDFRNKEIIPFTTMEFILPAYLDWYNTQTKPLSVSSFRKQQTWLGRRKEMWQIRAPGNTCLGSMEYWIKHATQPVNDSKGDGAVMRSLPFCFVHTLLPQIQIDSIQLAVDAGRLTHGHSDSEKAIRLYMAASMSMYLPDEEAICDSLAYLIQGVVEIYKPGTSLQSADDVHEKFGDTFTALPALVAALVVLKNAVHKQDYNVILEDSSVNNADSDTVAAIAGGLWGLRFPAPQKLIDRLVEKQLITDVVDWVFEEPSTPSKRR